MDRGLRRLNVPANQKWWMHPDTPDEVDVAVLPWVWDSETDGVSLTVQKWFLSDVDIQQNKIGPGDDVFTVGLFTKMTGTNRLVPIVRTGNIAMMPDEKISGIKIGNKWTGEVEAYLIEARSIGGISGSPVFVRQTVHNKTVDPQTGEVKGIFHGLGFQYFLGLVHGHWEIRTVIATGPE